jgi:hypothetical protein
MSVQNEYKTIASNYKYLIELIHRDNTLPNKILNGEFNISNRNRLGDWIPESLRNEYKEDSNPAYYFMDRWFGLSTRDRQLYFDINTNNDPEPDINFVLDGISTYMYVNDDDGGSAPPSSDEYFGFGQYIDPINTKDLNWGTDLAKSAVLSFWVYSDVTGDYGGTISNFTNNQNACITFKYTIDAAQTWEKKVVKIPGCTIGNWKNSPIDIYFSLGAGSNFTTNATGWNDPSGTFPFAPTGTVNFVGSGDQFRITGIQFETGIQGSNFQHLNRIVEESLCKRYFQKLELSSGSISPLFIAGTSTSCSIPLPVEMNQWGGYNLDVYINEEGVDTRSTNIEAVVFVQGNISTTTASFNQGVGSGTALTGVTVPHYAHYYTGSQNIFSSNSNSPNSINLTLTTAARNAISAATYGGTRMLVSIQDNIDILVDGEIYYND